MSFVPVSSSNLSAVSYADGVHAIRFKSGGVYRYFGVPETVYRDLLAAPSKGRYFARYIKNIYPFERAA